MVLPATFTGSPRYMHQRTQDAMAYVRQYGTPDLFITFTCNPNWHDITSNLMPSQQASDRYDIVSHVFHLKLKSMMKVIKQRQVFGQVQCDMLTVEWQKRDLPHAHILIWLQNKLRAQDVDQFICAEIPDRTQDQRLFNIVTSHMIHGPCGNVNCDSPCMTDGVCSKKYP